MRIVHLSDIHLSLDNITSLKQYYLEALIKDLSMFQKKAAIDLLLITGDLVDKGGISFKENNPYAIFEEEFIGKIISNLDISKQKILFIPGNHDINHADIEEEFELGLITKLKTVEIANGYLEKNKIEFSSVNKRIEKFKLFEKSFHKTTANYHYSNNESIYIYESIDCKIGFLLLNDSWRCSSMLKTENHFIGVNQLFNAKKFFEEQRTKINFVLFHHPIELFSETERLEIMNIIHSNNFNVIINGHTHDSKIEQIVTSQGNLFFFNAKSAFNNPRESVERYQPGYNIIDLNLKTLKFTLHVRKYIHKGFRFDYDTYATEGGKFKGKLLVREKAKNSAKKIKETKGVIGSKPTFSELKKEKWVTHYCNFLNTSFNSNILFSVHTNNTAHLWDLDDIRNHHSISPSNEGYIISCGVIGLSIDNCVVYLGLNTCVEKWEIKNNNKIYIGIENENCTLAIENSLDNIFFLQQVEGRYFLSDIKKTFQTSIPDDLYPIKIYAYSSILYIIGEGYRYAYQFDLTTKYLTQIDFNEEIIFNTSLSKLLKTVRINLKKNEFEFKKNENEEIFGKMQDFALIKDNSLAIACEDNSILIFNSVHQSVIKLLVFNQNEWHQNQLQ